jgi:hypothetical protein
MPYVYSQVDDLQETDKVGSKQCVDLVKHYGHLPQTALWKKGKQVFGDHMIAKGTAIATFIDGKYPTLNHGNHAAFYLSQDAGGIWVMDQWANDDKKPKVSKRYLSKKGVRSDGSYVDPSNNAEAFSVIE